MLRFLTFLAVVTGIVAPAFPASAFTVQPGEYKLEWQTPGPPQGLPFSEGFGPLTVARGENRRIFTGLRSDNALIGFLGEFLVYVDESAGTGTGYDTGYITRKLMIRDGETIDASEMTKFALIKDGDAFRPDPSQPLQLDVMLGPPEAGVHKTVLVALEAKMASSSVAGKPRMQCSLKARGGWFGSVKTDSADLPVQTLDSNHNCIYGEAVYDPRGNQRKMRVDEVAFYSPPDTPCHLGRTTAIDGQLYEITVTPCGDSLSIRPYSGERGTVRFKITNGFGKPAACEYVLFDGEGGSYRSELAKPVSVPVGRYICEFAAIDPVGRTNDRSRLVGLIQKIDKPIVITTNKVTDVLLGGPISLAIANKQPVTQVKRGSQVTLDMRLLFPNGRVINALAADKQREIHVAVVDNKGKPVFQSEAKSGWAAIYSCDVHIPANCPPGAYQIVATFDAMPYQKPLRLTQALKVTAQ